MLNLPGARPASPPFLRPPIVPTFRHGGRASIQETAEKLRRKGEGEDKVLAHIHPLEAAELERKYGHSGINPHTGLPQYGRWISKKITKHTKRWLPALASLAGAALLGPPGAVIGGGLGGAISGRRDAEGHRRFFSNVARGLGTGAMIGGGQWLGGQMGIPGMGGAAPGINGAAPAIQGAPVVKGVPSWVSGLPSPAAQTGGGGIGDIFSKIGGIFGGTQGNTNIPGTQTKDENMLSGLAKKLGLSVPQLGLAALTAYGTLKGKNKKPGPREDREDLPEFVRPRKELPRKQIQFARPYTIEPPEDYVPYGDGPQHDWIGYEGYAGGGYVHGTNPGQLDDVYTPIREGSFVIDASTLSDCGDGNSLAGDAKIDDFLMRNARKTSKKRSFAKGGINHHPMIPARVSSGEKIIDKEDVDALGKGSNARGAKKLQTLVNNVRLKKRGSTKLPKKIGSLNGLMGGR